MRVKSNFSLLLIMILAVFLLIGCGENGEQETTKAPQEVAQSNITPAASEILSDEERQRMYKILFDFLLTLDAYAIDKGEGNLPLTKDELESYHQIPLDGGYDFTYETTGSSEKPEDFTVTIFNLAKTYKLNFDSVCYKDSTCLNAWRDGFLNQKLDDSLIKPVM